LPAAPETGPLPAAPETAALQAEPTPPEGPEDGGGFAPPG
jgi:hypothetical protein